MEYPAKESGFFRSLRFLLSHILVLLVSAAAILANIGSIYMNTRYRSRELCSASASCSSVGTTVTCTGSGSITQEIIQQSGTYTKYEVARIEWGVTRIEARSFMYSTKLRDVSIPESVVYIGSEAFAGNLAASSITFPSSVTELHVMAVHSCHFLTHVHMAFQNGTYKSEDGMIMLTKDGYKGLYIVGSGRCSGGTLEIPAVDKILTCALRWNRAAVIKVPDSVIEIQGYVFHGCNTMHTLELGKGLQVLHKDAIGVCTALASIVLHSDNSYFYQETGTTYQIFGRKHSGSSNPQSLIWISPTSTYVTIPGTVSEIGSSALQVCPSLSSVHVESTSTTFSVQCGGLVVCSKDGSVGKFAAGGSVDVIINTNVTFLAERCFMSVSSLKTIKFHSKVVGCGNDCFRDCSALHTVDFASCTMRLGTGSNAAHALGTMVFSHCHSLTTILNWPTNSFSLYEAAFASCAFEELVLPQQIVEIGERALQSCSKLQTVMIPRTVTSIGLLAFTNCEKLRNVIFESGSTLNQIDSLAMSSCIQLATITLPDSLTSIDNDCFLGDTMLTNINFERNSGLYWSDGVAVYTDNTLMLCPPGVSSITMHPETRIIATRAFCGCSKLIHVDTSELVERIEGGAFMDCMAIKSVRLSASVSFIGSSAFNACPALREVFYCSNSDVRYEADPFPTNPVIYCFYDFPGGLFCGHTCSAILDYGCNIPTDFFSSDVYHRTSCVYFAMYTLVYSLLD